MHPISTSTTKNSHSTGHPKCVSPSHINNMVNISKIDLEKLKIIKAKLSKMSKKDKIALLNDRGVAKLLSDAAKDIQNKS